MSPHRHCHHARPKPFYFTPSVIAVAILLAGGTVHAQTAGAQTGASTEAGTQAPSSAKTVNGFAPVLKPTVKRRTSHNDAAYAPIKPTDDQGQTPEIEMFVGESRVFPAPGVGRVAVGNGQILTAAALDKREILLFANGVGTSSLFIWNEDGRYQRVKINIVPGDTSRIGREIAAFLTSIPGTRASIVGDKVIVEGEHLSSEDMAKLTKLEKTYPQIVNFVDTQGWEKMIMMDVKVVEFPRSEMRELGLKWTPTGGGTIAAIWTPFHSGKDGPYQVNIPVPQGQTSLPITDVGQTSATLPKAMNAVGGFNLGLNAQLNALAQNGKASVLAEPQLSARSGSEAHFHAGGELPYVVSSLNGQTINFKPYGIELDISPVVDRYGYIRAKITTSVSSIDSAMSTPEGPALKKRSTETELNVRSGETMVLSGMLSRDNSTTVDKVPFLGDIPILGALFRSTRYQNNETELVIFVTPVVVDAQTPGLVDRVEQTKKRLTEQFGEQPFLSDALQPNRDAARYDLPSKDAPGNVAPAASAARVSPAPVQQKPLTETAARLAPTSSPLVPAGQSPLAPTAQPKPTSTVGANLRVLLEGLAMRSAPDINSPILMKLGNNAIVQLGDQPIAPELASAWRNVTVGEVNGWVAAKWVAPTSRAPSPSSKGGAAAVEAQSGKKLGTFVGSAPAVALTVDSKADAPPATRQYKVILPKLALRVAPDMNAEILLQIPADTMVLAKASDARGGWLPVTLGDKHGWVAAQWLEAQP